MSENDYVFGDNPLEDFIVKTVGIENKDSEVAKRLRSALRNEVVNIQKVVKAAEDSQLREAYLKEMVANRGNIQALVKIKQRYSALGLNVY